MGGLKTSQIKSPVPGATSLLFIVLASRKYLLCCNEVNLLCSQSLSHFIDYFKQSLLFFCTRSITQLEVIDPLMPWENILVCAQAVFWTCADPAFQGSHYFSLAQQGMTIPTDQPNVLLFGLCCIAVFCFYSFPMVIFSWLSQSNRRLTINPCIYIINIHIYISHFLYSFIC